jgi:hypothetical protein
MVTPAQIRRIKRLGFVGAFFAVALCSADSKADEIRHFSLAIKEALGRQLYEKMQGRASPLTQAQERAKQAAIKALPKLGSFFRFVVLPDPDGNGSLVYAVATNPNPNMIVVCAHFRVTVSSENKVERVDRLGTASVVMPKNGPKEPPGYTHTGFYAAFHIEDTEPLETLVYSSLLHHERCAVVTSDGVMWFVENGKIMKNHNPENI